MGGLIKLSNFAKLSGYAEMFGQGLAITVMLSIGTVAVGAVLGVILALMRMSDVRPFRWLGLDKEGRLRGPGVLTTLSKFNPLSFLATAYVEILRSTPVIVQIAVIYYGIFGAVAMLWLYLKLGLEFVWKFFKNIRELRYDLMPMAVLVSLGLCAGYLLIAGHILFSVTSGFYFSYMLLFGKITYTEDMERLSII